MQLRYVEGRRYHTPVVLTTADVEDFEPALSLDLADLAADYCTAGDDPQLKKQYAPTGGGRAVTIHRFPVFARGMRCTVTQVPDPGDQYGTSRALCVRFDDAATAAISQTAARALTADEQELAQRCPLIRISMRWLPNCPMADVLTTYDVPVDRFVPEEYDDLQSEI